MMCTMTRRVTGGLLAAVVVACGLAVAGVAPATAASTENVSCQVKSLQKATKPVEITFWHSMTRENETTLKAITDEFNMSQSDVKVSLVNQVTYDDTLTKYTAGLASGDLPDLVQLRETEQQQMIDSQSIVPAGVCAKEDKYSFSDFLPRVVSYYTVEGQMYGMPFNTSGPVLYYNKQAFTKAGLDPEQPPRTLDEVRAAAEKLASSGAVNGPPLGLKVEPGFVEHWLALSSKLYVDNSNGRTSRADASVLNSATGKKIFSWLSGMVDDDLAATNPPEGAGSFDNLLGIGTGNHAMAFDTSAALSTIQGALGGFPNVTIGVAPMPGLQVGKGGVLVSGGALFVVKNDTPAKQAAAWKYATYLDDTETQVQWALGSGYMPIRTSAADSPQMSAFWAKNPFAKVAYDQLATGPVNAATAGSVIGDYSDVRDAVRDAEDAMFLDGTAPTVAVKAAAAASTATMKDYNGRLGVG